MVVTLLALSALLAGSAPDAPADSGWEMVYEASVSDGFVDAVWAVGRDEWFVAGKWGVTRVTNAGKEIKTTRSAVAGLFGESANSVFALGYDELVLHFDGKGWAQEHFVPVTRRRLRDYDDLLYSAFAAPGDPTGTLVAFGPHAVLQRQADRTWHAPAEPERERLSRLGQTGPAARPAGCDEDSWFWLGKDLAWFMCQDRRTFISERGEVIPKGRMPASCRTQSRAAHAGGEIYVACDDRGVWRTHGQEWRRLPRIPDNASAVFAISAADRCVFVTSRRTVWRRCER